MSVVGRSGEVTEGLCAEMHASDAALGSVGRWLLLHQTVCPPLWRAQASGRRTRWWCYDRRVASASVGGGVSRAQRQRK
jgi:hypothetical protein